MTLRQLRLSCRHIFYVNRHAFSAENSRHVLLHSKHIGMRRAGGRLNSCPRRFADGYLALATVKM